MKTKATFLRFTRLCYSICLLLCCGLLSTTQSSAQELPEWKFTVAKPAMHPLTDVTATSLTAVWSNIPIQKEEKGSPWNLINFHFTTTREILAKENKEYSIAHAKIQPAKGGKTQELSGMINPSLLDKQLSQPAWYGTLCNWTANGISLDATRYTGENTTPDDIGLFTRITSPLMALSNGGGEYTLTFTAKVLKGSSPAKLRIMGYMQEYAYTSAVPGVQEVSVPNDGKLHAYNLNMTGGTWCHRLVIELISAQTEVEFSDSFIVKQQLKKGDTAFRSTFYQEFGYKDTKPLSEPSNDLLSWDNFFVKYSRTFTDLDKRCLDDNQAKLEGERVGCRILYSDIRPSNKKPLCYKSMYSEPIFLTNQPEENRYIYLGYTGYEEPNYSATHPSGANWAGHHGGAIKITKELLKNNIGDKVVGLRFVTAACMQKNQVNTPSGIYDVKDPFIFLAKSLKTHTEGSLNDTIMTKSSEQFKDGWNSIFFDKPYEITAESEFFAGLYAYDAAQKGGIVVGSIKERTKNPNAVYLGTNWGSYTFSDALFSSHISTWDHPLLIQVIVEPKEMNSTKQNKGEVVNVKAPSMVYSEEPLNANFTILNSGIKAISNILVEISFNGTTTEKQIDLSAPIVSTQSQDIEIKGFEHKGEVGVKTLKVTLKKVNNVDLITPTTASAEIEVIKKDEAFERTALVEVFTSEHCSQCPQADVWFENLLTQPENKELVQHMAVVSHHSFFKPDFLSLSYSKGLAPFYGVINKSGEISLNPGYTSPAVMINRTLNPALKGNKGQNSSIYSLIATQDVLNNAMDYAIKKNPATAKAVVKPFFDKTTNTLNVKVDGLISSRFDRSRPLHITIMVTQDEIATRDQMYNPTEKVSGFAHHNVLRVVDDAGFKGTEVTINADGSFSFEKEIPIQSTTNTQSYLPDNTILIEKDNKTIVDALQHANVIAVLHHYSELPTNDNVEENDSRLLKNEVINVAQRRVSFTKFDEIMSPTHQKVNVYVENGSIHTNVKADRIQIYDIYGALVPNYGLISGVYVVRIFTSDNRSVVTKVIIP